MMSGWINSKNTLRSSLDANTNILTTATLSSLLDSELKSVQRNLLFVSAFCKLDVLRFVDEKLDDKIIKKDLIVRFRLSDITAGATDFEIINYCKLNQWKLRILLDLHAKTYIFDNKKVIIGSANLTQNGIGISNSPNTEMSAAFELPESEVKRLSLEFEKAVEIDDNTFRLMKAKLLDLEQTVYGKNQEWGSEIAEIFNSDVDVLFVEDFDDLSSHNLVKSRPYNWLLHALNTSENGELYYGNLSQKLHSSLLNQPEPYRKEVKVLLSNLLELCAENEDSCITVTRPNYSQLVKLRCY